MDEPSEHPPPPPHPSDAELDDKLPTLELEIAKIQREVKALHWRMTWLELGVQAWARGRDWRGNDDADHRR